MAPAERVHLRNVEQLTRRTVRLRRVPGEFATKSDNLANQLRQLPNRDILAAPDVDDLGAVVSFEEENAGRRKVIDVEKFAARFSRAPDDQLALFLLFRRVRL